MKLTVIKRLFLASIAASALVAPAQAIVVTGSITGGSAAPGSFHILTPPFAVGNNNQQANNKLFAWNERQNVVLGSPLALDFGGTLAAGTRVSSHGIVFDPQATRTLVGSVTFDRPIIGVIWTTSRLVATDALFGLPGITYNSPSARGLEAADIAGTSVVGNTLFIDAWRASSPGDNIRVLTAGAIPEPATWAMLIAGFGMIGLAARRRRPVRALVA